MLVSHRYKFIYTKTVKTAGTSVEVYFEPFCIPEGKWISSPVQARDEYISEFGIVGYRGSKVNRPKNCIWWNHMPASLIKKRIGEKIWTTYFKFCVVRNPYEKAVSEFYFSRRKKNFSVQLNNLEKEQSLFQSWLQSFGDTLDRDKYMINEAFCLDDFIRYETLEIDLERVCMKLDIPWNPALMPTFKKGVRPQNRKAEDLYTEKSRQLVESIYGFELEYFNYTFPYNNNSN